MATVSRTAGAAGSINVTIRNAAGQLLTPVSTPVVQWFTDAARTTGALTLSTTGSGSSYTSTWTGAQAPATTATRYLKVTIEVSAGVFAVDADDDISFVTGGAVIVVTDYTTLAAVKADLGLTSSTNDAAISAAITAASRAIDQMTETTFYPVTEARVYSAGCEGRVWVDRFTSTGGLTVATGTDGTYPTAIASTAFVLWPYNAPNRGQAYERLDFPDTAYTTRFNRPTLQVTAAWGWHFVPPDVEQAARIKAIHLYHRRESPHGSTGLGDDPSTTRMDGMDDQDVIRLLRPYMHLGIA